MMRFVFGLLLLMFGTQTALADDAPLYPKQDCQAVIQSASAFHACYAANLEAANKALDRLYNDLMHQQTFYVGSADALRDVERAWIVYKDKECKYEYGDGTSGNEDYWLAHADCEIRVTEARIVELKGRPSCTGGGSLCTPHMR
jgi:uncharacterized protein YecT (DUF1311 family)